MAKTLKIGHLENGKYRTVCNLGSPLFEIRVAVLLRLVQGGERRHGRRHLFQI